MPWSRTGPSLHPAFSAAGCGWSEGEKAASATAETLPCQGLGLGSGPGNCEFPVCHTLQPAPRPLPLSSQQRPGQTLAGGGERPGKLAACLLWTHPCIPSPPGPSRGPQIWHFLFGLGQRSAALEALALMGRAPCFPSSHDPSSPAWLPGPSPPTPLWSATSPLLPRSRRGQALGGTGSSGWATSPQSRSHLSIEQMGPEGLRGEGPHLRTHRHLSGPLVRATWPRGWGRGVEEGRGWRRQAA